MDNKIIEFPKNKKKELEKKQDIGFLHRLLDEYIKGDYHLVIDGDKNQHLFDKETRGRQVVFTTNIEEYKILKNKKGSIYPLKGV